MYDVIVVGAGIAGVTAAQMMSERGHQVLVLEQRSHVGGNCYEARDKYGVICHTYGPHIFHTSDELVYRYLSRFTSWSPYHHEVAGLIDGKYIPIPFNLNSIEMVYDKEKAARLEKILIDTYGEGARVPILELRGHKDEEIRELAEYVYQNVFLHYTMKQWGKKPDEIDPSVSARVPVLVSHTNGYFQDKYQEMPDNGFTAMMTYMLTFRGIEVRLNVKAEDVIQLIGDKIYFEGNEFKGEVIYTGAIDEFFGCKYGRLPYRTLHFEMEHYEDDSYQPYPVVNYTVSEEYTRISEFRKMTNQQDGNGTTIMKEYPMTYTGEEGQIPYYAIENPENRALYDKYKKEAEACPRFHLMGRLAEYKYYNIDATVSRAQKLVQSIG